MVNKNCQLIYPLKEKILVKMLHTTLLGKNVTIFFFFLNIGGDKKRPG